MLKDLRFAFRMLASRPWFSATVIVTLALSIGVNTTIFTLVNAVLFKPVPLPNGERMVVVSERLSSDPRGRLRISLAEFHDYRAQTRTLDGLEAVERTQGVISEAGNPPERYDMGLTSSGLFGMLQTYPVMGRPFAPADALKGAAPVVLIGHSVWQKRYNGAADIVGRVVRINGIPATIVGVMPAGFRFPDTRDLWMPLVPTPEDENRAYRRLMAFGLLSKGTDISTAQLDLARISGAMSKEFPATNKDVAALVQTFQEAFNGGPVRFVFLLTQGAVGFVLLIACANVANMMLSRAESRSREIAVRAAVGASRVQIIRQLLTESIVLSVIGGSLGLILSQFGVNAFDLATQNVGKPYWVKFTMDWRAFGYFAIISIATGLIFGIVPALRASRVDLNTALKDGSAAGTRRGGRLTSALVVFQFALTLVLLSGAGLMIRSFLEARLINPFVPAEHLLTARVSLPDGKGERYESVDARRKMHDLVFERLSALPGVSGVALASDMPGLGSQSRDIEIEGQTPKDPKQLPRAAAVFATPSYLPTIGQPLLMGRPFNTTDGLEGREASVVTRAFATRFWPDSSPIGKRFRFITDGKPAAWNTVIGVCGDVVQDTMAENPAPLAYFSDRQEPWAWMGILLRTRGDPAADTSSLRAALQEIDPNLPLFDVRTLPDAIDSEHWFLKVFGALFLSFALIALLMASVGVYAVVAQSTSRRTREIGIRMALGASAGRVVRLVLARGLIQLGIGLVVGLTCAIFALRLMHGIPGLSQHGDSLVLVVVGAILVAVGGFACWLPAQRAALVAPTEALRAE